MWPFTLQPKKSQAQQSKGFQNIWVLISEPLKFGLNLGLFYVTFRHISLGFHMAFEGKREENNKNVAQVWGHHEAKSLLV